ncbi:hypothetical protein HK099_000782 [Clydaea vesicula]|uniref:Uncharacterized protein n=1 Tax=Clydaea vesicula TaxID=447962 RepID=A0AAD5U7N6_9FUNG|nr:hypothetical protein HK099_000782 [Clydaea vesicula]
MEEIDSFKSYLDDLVKMFLKDKPVKPPTFRNHCSPKKTNYQIWKESEESKLLYANMDNPYSEKKIELPESVEVNLENVHQKLVLPDLKKKMDVLLGVAEFNSRFGEIDERSKLLGIGSSSATIDIESNVTSDGKKILNECNIIADLTNLALHKMMQRGETLYDIKVRADNLKGAGNLFKKKTANVERDTYVQSLKVIFKFILGWDRSCIGAAPGTVWGCPITCTPGTLGCPLGMPPVMPGVPGAPGGAPMVPGAPSGAPTIPGAPPGAPMIPGAPPGAPATPKPPSVYITYSSLNYVKGYLKNLCIKIKMFNFREKARKTQTWINYNKPL